MSLHLPPERDLPDPEAMMNRILSDPAADFAAPRRPRRWVVPAAAAAVLVAFGGGVLWGTQHFRDDGANAGAAPSTSVATQSAAPSSAGQPVPTRTAAGSQKVTVYPTVTPAGTAPVVMPGGGTVVLPHFALTVVPIDTKRPDLRAVSLKVCVRDTGPSPDPQGRTRVSRERWTLRSVAGASIPQVSLPDSFPYETKLPQGGCASGVLAFGPVQGPVVLAYQNEYAEQAQWVLT